MHEDILQTIWKYQLFDKNELKTSSGVPIKVIDQGRLNENAGPDFSDASIKFDGLEWFGSVEIHQMASGWQSHKHHLDPAYNTTILHVVWSEDEEIKRQDDSSLPTLELSGRVPEQFIDNARTLMESVGKQACEQYLSDIPTDVIQELFSLGLEKRIQRRAGLLVPMINNEEDLGQIYYSLIACSLGGKVNSDAMGELARRIPLNLLINLKNDLSPYKALLYCSGLRKKNQILEVPELISKMSCMDLAWWRFSRLRPASFPQNRIRQLGSIANIIDSQHLSRVIAGDLEAIANDLNKATTSEFGNCIGSQMLNSLLINAAMILREAYHLKSGASPSISSKELLEQLPAERNNISARWQKSGVKPKNAFDSQAMIEVWNNQCASKQCLSCSIGKNLLSRS